MLLFGSNGRFYTLGCDRLPSARGHGEPVRLMIELGNEQDIVALAVFKGGRKFLVASDAGRGFIVPEDKPEIMELAALGFTRTAEPVKTKD